MARCQRGRIGGRTLGLDADDLDVPAERGVRGGGDPGKQAAAPGGDDDGAGVRHLRGHLQGHRRLPGDDVLVVEGVDHHLAGALGLGPGLGKGLIHRAAVDAHLGAIATGRSELGQSRTLGHVNGCGDAQHPGGECHPLGMVAGTGREYTGSLLVVIESAHPGVGTPDLERTAGLQVLALEPYLSPGELADRAAVLHRGLLHHTAQRGSRLADGLDRHAHVRLARTRWISGGISRRGSLPPFK